MKKYIFLSFCLIINSLGFSQVENFKSYFGCYGDNDTLTIKTIQKTKALHILGNGESNVNVKKWEVVIQVKKGKAYTFKSNSSLVTDQIREELLKNFKRTEKITIQNVSISAFNKKTKQYEESIVPPVTLYLNEKGKKKCDEKTSQAQDDLVLKFSCFKSGDMASIKEILRYPTFTIINSNPQVDIKIISYNYIAPKMDGRRNPTNIESITNTALQLNDSSFNIAKKLLPGESFILSDIKVEFSNRKTKSKEVITVNPIIITLDKKSTGKCGDVSIDSLFVLEYTGKLLTGKDKNLPLRNQKVVLKDANDSIIQTTFTNSYGDFTFKNLNADEHYLVSVPVEDNTQIKDMQIHLAKVDGTIIKTMEKSGNAFIYKVLPAELNILAREVEEDTELRIKNFGTSSQTELVVVGDIYYAPNSAEIDEESMKILDKITTSMTLNPALKLAIESHTDAKGEDSYNLSLSTKRSQTVVNYLISKGIATNRLSAKGYGETQIKNRCKNGIDCSELEHELNRRTEFKFTK
jgi:outer membrane protein OmpA-like peptidoglycan-associated protein